MDNSVLDSVPVKSSFFDNICALTDTAEHQRLRPYIDQKGVDILDDIKSGAKLMSEGRQIVADLGMALEGEIR